MKMQAFSLHLFTNLFLLPRLEEIKGRLVRRLRKNACAFRNGPKSAGQKGQPSPPLNLVRLYRFPSLADFLAQPSLRLIMAKMHGYA